jgi:O-acetylserine/cysteine efflux transporter
VLIGLTVGADLPVFALALALSGALSWAVGNLLMKRAQGVPMFQLVVWCSLIPPLPMLVLSAFWGEAPLTVAVSEASWSSLASAAYLGAIATGVYAIWGNLLTRYPAAAVAPLALISPVTGVIASALVFGERFTALRYAGMALIMIGLSIIILPVAKLFSCRSS